MNYIRRSLDERKECHVVSRLLDSYEDMLCDKFNILSVPYNENWVKESLGDKMYDVLDWVYNVRDSSELVHTGLLKLSKKKKSKVCNKYNYYYNKDLNMVIVSEFESNNIVTAFKHNKPSSYVMERLSKKDYKNAILKIN